SPGTGPATANIAPYKDAPVSLMYCATAVSRSANISLAITTMRSGRPVAPASAKRLWVPPTSARRIARMMAAPALPVIFLAARSPRRQAKPVLRRVSVRARQAQHMRGRVGEDQVGPDRAFLG